MPFVNVIHSDDTIDNDLLAINLTEVISKITGKPKQYVQVNILKSECLFFGGNNSPSAKLEFQAINQPSANWSAALTESITRFSRIQPERVFITYTLFDASNWSYNGATLG
jgi:phenylpyruvate tautomerase PptA (4-oxalocrotonate tautomerase family)